MTNLLLNHPLLGSNGPVDVSWSSRLQIQIQKKSLKYMSPIYYLKYFQTYNCSKHHFTFARGPATVHSKGFESGGTGTSPLTTTRGGGRLGRGGEDVARTAGSGSVVSSCR